MRVGHLRVFGEPNGLLKNQNTKDVFNLRACFFSRTDFFGRKHQCNDYFFINTKIHDVFENKPDNLLSIISLIVYFYCCHKTSTLYSVIDFKRNISRVFQLNTHIFVVICKYKNNGLGKSGAICFLFLIKNN